MQAIVLAGGLGTRLRSVVADKPKALSPVAGNPFLKYVIDFLIEEGVTDFIFSLGFLADQIIKFLENDFPNINYQYYIEDEPLGTGGAIKKCIELANEENVLIVNADTYFDVPLQTMFKNHQENHAHCTIALKEMNNFNRYGTVIINSLNTILSFQEKKLTQNGFINGGYLIFNKNYFINKTQQLPSVFSYEKDFLEKNLKEMIIKGFVSNGYFIDIGIPKDFEIAQNFFINFQ